MRLCRPDGGRGTTGPAPGPCPWERWPRRRPGSARARVPRCVLSGRRGKTLSRCAPRWWRSSSSSDAQTAWWRRRWVAPTSRRRRRPGPRRPGFARALRTRLRAAPCLLAPSWGDAGHDHPSRVGRAPTRRILARRTRSAVQSGPNFPTTWESGASIRPDSLQGAATATPHRGSNTICSGGELVRSPGRARGRYRSRGRRLHRASDDGDGKHPVVGDTRRVTAPDAARSPPGSVSPEHTVRGKWGAPAVGRSIRFSAAGGTAARGL